MARYNYKMADCVGRQNLAGAIAEGAEDGWEVVSFCFGGVKQVQQVSLDPRQAPVQQLPIFILLLRKEELSEEEKAMFKDGIVKA